MIFGVGIDTIEVERIERSILQYGDQFVSRIFSAEEIRYCSRKPHKYEHFAARFAAKEAFAKALGTGIRRGFVWKSVSVAHEFTGRPFIRLLDTMPARAEAILGKDFRILLSLTHTKSLAEATAIIEVER
jgi:holo-[acyl-carrier protein] synthase